MRISSVQAYTEACFDSAEPSSAQTICMMEPRPHLSPAFVCHTSEDLQCCFFKFRGLHESLVHAQGKKVVADLPILGTALPILITKPGPAERQGRGPLLLPSVGTWVKLRNVKAWVVAGQLQVQKSPYVMLLLRAQ